MHKKIISVILAVIIFCGNFVIGFSAEKKAPVDLGALPVKSIILIDEETGRVLYEKNADEKMPPASITKVMTMLLIVEAIEENKITLDDMVTCSQHASSIEGVTIWFEQGEKLSVNDLLKAVAISSANDAAVALAEHIGGTEEKFAVMMNERAQQLGMTGTNFENASGLDAKEHYSTARDIAIMSSELLSHEMVKEYTTIWMDSLRQGKTELVNTNKLIRFYKGATGLKTGTTNSAGNCLTASATRDNLSIITVVLGAKTSDERFESAKAVLDYGFANYTSVGAPDVSEDLKPIKVINGTKNKVNIKYEAPKSLALSKDEKDKIKWEISLADDVKAPVEKGQVLGKVIISIDGTAICEYPIKSDEDIEQMTFIRALGVFGKSMIKMK